MCLGLESFQWILTCNPFSQDTLSTGSIMGCNSEFLSVFFFIELLGLPDHQHLHLIELVVRREWEEEEERKSKRKKPSF